MKRFRPLLIIPALAALAACSRHDAPVSHNRPDSPPVAVAVEVAQSAKVPSFIEVTGTVRPVRRATIAAKVMGTIEDMPVTLGQSVKAGDVLVRISAVEISTKVVQAKAQLNQAHRDLERESSLLTKGASTADMVKGLEDRVTMSSAMLREAEVMLDYTIVRAPFDGVIARKPAHTGEMAAPGMALVDIEDARDFEIEAGVPDSLARGLSVGAALRVDIPADELAFEGTLSELSSAADARARTVQARVAVPTGVRVRSGQFARLQVPGESVASIFVPKTALTTLGQMDRVFIMVDRRAVLRLVKPGARRGDRIEILSGLAAGETVVVNPPENLREGQSLEVLP